MITALLNRKAPFVMLKASIRPFQGDKVNFKGMISTLE